MQKAQTGVLIAGRQQAASIGMDTNPASEERHS